MHSGGRPLWRGLQRSCGLLGTRRTNINKTPLLPTTRAHMAATPKEFLRIVPYVHSPSSAHVVTHAHWNEAPLAGTSPLWSEATRTKPSAPVSPHPALPTRKRRRRRKTPANEIHAPNCMPSLASPSLPAKSPHRSLQASLAQASPTTSWMLGSLPCPTSS